MSFLGFGGAPQPTSAQKLAAAEQEIEMYTDMFTRLSNSCTKKCIPPDYKEGELNKGESVCLDRCVAKFFDVNIKVRSGGAGRGGWARRLTGRIGVRADAGPSGGERRSWWWIRRRVWTVDVV
jgi:import inner membrane translocase subunit TIM10